MRYFITLIALLLISPAKSQVIYGLWQDALTNDYYLVEIDPATGIQTQVGSINSVQNYIIPATAALNSDSNEYLFAGTEGSQYYIYRIDIATGGTKSKFQFTENWFGLEYNCRNGQYYALMEDDDDYFLIHFNPVSGVTFASHQLVGVNSHLSTGFVLDVNSGRYTFNSLSGSDYRLLTIDIQNGNIVYDPIITENIAALEYNYMDSLIYGLWEDTATGDYHLVTLDPITANHNSVGVIPGISPGLVFESHTIDPASGTFTYLGFAGPDLKIITINLNDASIINMVDYTENPTGLKYFSGCNNTAPPLADFEADSLFIQAGTTVDFTDLSLNGPTSWSWEFDGGLPSNSTDQHPTGVQYDSAGCYLVSLIAGNTNGNDTIEKTCYIEVIDPGAAPVANFEANKTSILVGDTIHFTDLSGNAPTSWSWAFQNGIPDNSSIQHPTNIVYNQPGCFDVTLIATNSKGEDTLTKTCYIDVSEINSLTEINKQEVDVFPNPFHHLISINNPNNENFQIEIFDTNGTLIVEHAIENSSLKDINMHNLQPGVYLIKIQFANKTIIKKVVKA